VRWDRVGRLAMLCVLVALLYLYLSAGLRMLSTYRQAHSDRAAVAALTRERTALQRRHAALSRRSTVEAQARRLSMARPGELQYVLSGLPRH
jgi:cell division protein FtsB